MAQRIKSVKDLIDRTGMNKVTALDLARRWGSKVGGRWVFDGETFDFLVTLWIMKKEIERMMRPPTQVDTDVAAKTMHDIGSNFVATMYNIISERS